MPLSADITLQIGAVLTGALDIEVLKSSVSQNYRLALTDGVGAGQANNIWTDRRNLASGASETLDLAGALANAFNQVLTFTKVKAIIIKSDDANTTVLTVGNVANGIVAPFGAATQSIAINPGGLFVIATGDNTAYPITASTADLLKIANASGAAANYDIIIIGVA